MESKSIAFPFGYIAIAGTVGFEPARLTATRLANERLKPLDQLSTCGMQVLGYSQWRQDLRVSCSTTLRRPLCQPVAALPEGHIGVEPYMPRVQHPASDVVAGDGIEPSSRGYEPRKLPLLYPASTQT